MTRWDPDRYQEVRNEGIDIPAGAALDSAVVHKTNVDETILGTKTFSLSPKVPITPALNNSAVAKIYVDNADATKVSLTGNQTVAGVKTFSSSPISSVAATSDGQLVRYQEHAADLALTVKTNAVDQTVLGVKTFGGEIKVPVPTLANHAARKDYVDALAQYAPYVPTWTAATTPPSLGNGQIWGGSYYTNDIVDLEISLLIGTTTTLGVGNWMFGIPAGLTLITGEPLPIGTCMVLDDSIPNYYCGVSYYGGGTAGTGVYAVAPYGNQPQALPLDSTHPMGFAANDRVRISLRCRRNV